MNWYEYSKNSIREAAALMQTTPVKQMVDTPTLNSNGDRVGPASSSIHMKLNDPNLNSPWEQGMEANLEDMRWPDNITNPAEALALKQKRQREGGTDMDSQSMASIEGTNGQQYQRDGGPRFHETNNPGIGTGSFS